MTESLLLTDEKAEGECPTKERQRKSLVGLSFIAAFMLSYIEDGTNTVND